MASVAAVRRTALAGSAALLAAIVVACGGTSATPGNSSDAGTSDEASPGSDAGGVDGDGGDGAVPAEAGTADAAGACVELPAEGSACAPGQVSCDRVDLCCASAAQCDASSKTWRLSGNACLLCPTHGCGDKTCAGTEMCVPRAPGVPGGMVSYECAPYPKPCAREWTCACVEKNLPVGCMLAPNGCNDAMLPVKLSCMGI